MVDERGKEMNEDDRWWMKEVMKWMKIRGG